jgi:hypothetical protein
MHRFTGRILAIVLAVIMAVALAVPVVSAKPKNVRVKPGDIKGWSGDQVFDLPAAPYLQNGSTMVPLQFIATELGAKVWYDQQTDQIHIEFGIDNEVVLVPRSKWAKVRKGDQWTEKFMPVPTAIIKARSFVPLRFLLEALGAQVDWDPKTGQIIITLPGLEPDTPIPDDNTGEYKDVDFDEVEHTHSAEVAEKGVTGEVANGKLRLTVCLGAMPNPGYGVKVTAVKVNDEKKVLAIIAEKTLPDPDMMYAQVIVFPTATVEVDDKYEDYRFILNDEEPQEDEIVEFDEVGHATTTDPIAKGVTGKVKNGQLQLTVSLGGASNAGWGVRVLSVVASPDDKVLTILAEKVAPKTGVTYAEVQCYPTTTIAIDDKYDGYEYRLQDKNADEIVKDGPVTFREVQAVTSRVALERGATTEVVNGELMLKVCLGQAPNQGWRVRVTSVVASKANKALTVTAERVPPAVDARLRPEVSYPNTTIAIDDVYAGYKVNLVENNAVGAVEFHEVQHDSSVEETERGVAGKLAGDELRLVVSLGEMLNLGWRVEVEKIEADPITRILTVYAKRVEPTAHYEPAEAYATVTVDVDEKYAGYELRLEEQNEPVSEAKGIAYRTMQTVTAHQEARDRGVTTETVGEELRATVCLGPQPNPGYSIEIVSVKADDVKKTVIITARAQAPDPGKMYAQVISYPTITIVVDHQYSSYTAQLVDEAAATK